MFGCFHFGTGVATVERNSGVILSIFDTWETGKLLSVPCLPYNGCRLHLIVPLQCKLQCLSKLGIFAFSFWFREEIMFKLRNSSSELWRNRLRIIVSKIAAQSLLSASNFEFQNCCGSLRINYIDLRLVIFEECRLVSLWHGVGNRPPPVTLAWGGGECVSATILWRGEQVSFTAEQWGWNPRRAAGSFCEQPGGGFVLVVTSSCQWAVYHFRCLWHRWIVLHEGVVRSQGSMLRDTCLW